MRRVDHVVAQYGDMLGDRPDCDVVELTDAQLAEIQSIVGSGDGVRLDPDGTVTAFHPPILAPTVDPAFRADAQTCRDFLANVTPTAGQIVQAEKALIRIVGRIVRELA